VSHNAHTVPPPRRMVLRWTTSIAVLLLMPALAGTQEPPPMSNAPGDSIPRLELRRDPSVGRGNVASIQGTVGPEGLRFIVGELSILQPVMVMLLARDEADDLTLSLFKKNWTTARRSASTRRSGIARFEFRTQGGVNILLRGAAAGTPFALVVWAGEELRPSMPDVVLTYDEFRQQNPNASVSLRGRPSGGNGTGSRMTSIAMWIAIVIAGGIAGFFALRALGRRTHA